MMAKRSDFAQKLLDDLRLRKERMGATQSSSRTNPTTGDVYSYSMQTYKGSREKFTYKTVGSKMGNTHRRSSGGNKSLAIEDAKQIVSAGRGRSSEHIGDLSMALAFALQNGGKLGGMEFSGSSSILGFLRQIGRGSVDVGKIEIRSSFDKHRPSTSQFPMLSHLHVKEISKGAQKLNQILRACSNGLNFDRYSIEIGKELLKGAMDLEESLRMLVNLQEASECMVSPQKKNRIRLLEDDEDEDDNTMAIVEHMPLDRPRFSFDKPSRHSHGMQEVSRTGLKQKQATLTYPTKDHNFNHENQTSNESNLLSHSRSASHGSNIRSTTPFSEKKTQSSSSVAKPEKKGISNVIAKLMGLQELPEHVESKHIAPKESGSKQKIETISMKNARWSTNTDESKTKETQNLAIQTIKQNAIQANKIPSPPDNAFVLRAAKSLLTSSSRFEMVLHGGKPPLTDSDIVEDIKSNSGSRNATVKVNKQQNNSTKLNPFTGSTNHILERERRQDNPKRREPTGTGKIETKAAESKDELQQMVQQPHKSLEAANILHEKIRGKESTLQTEKRSTNRPLAGNQHKHHNDHGLHQKNELGISQPQEEKHLAEEKEHQTAKSKLQARKQKGNEAAFRSTSKPMHDRMDLQMKNSYTTQYMPNKRSPTEAIDALPSKGSPRFRHHEDLVKDESTTNSDLVTGNSGFENAKAGSPPVMEEKFVQVTASQKNVHNTKVHKKQPHRKMDEVVPERSANPHNLARMLKKQISVSQEMKYKRGEKISGPKRTERVSASRSKKEEIHIVKSNISEVSIQSLNVEQQLQRAVEEVSAIYSPVEDECQILKESHIHALNDRNQMKTSDSSKLQGQVPTFGKDRELKSQEPILSPSNGTHEMSLDIFYPSKVEQQKVFKPRKEEQLTDEEIHLKQILILNQLFLNTAEALFKLNIPVGILHASGHDYQDEDGRLILDCGYEIMKRKGRRQELTIHPFMKTSISSIKVKSFNDLVKQLHKDFEKLKSYYMNGSKECDVADYLPKMIEKDVHVEDPDTNCMWDFGWNETMSTFIEKDEVIRDVERHVINGLIDELTADFLHLSVSS